MGSRTYPCKRHRAAIIGWLNDRAIQISTDDGSTWQDIEDPLFDIDCEYRVKPMYSMTRVVADSCTRDHEWNIYSPEGDRITTIYDEFQAKDIVERLNRGIK